MKAMILAAGRGERLRPLTDKIPKPLVPLAGKPLIVYLIERLRNSGFKEIVINVSYLADQIMQTLGTGEKFGVKIEYSIEPETGGLETGGGIFRALPLLSDPFIVVNGDIWTDYPFENLNLPENKLGFLVLVNNPPHNPQGDFHLSAGRIVTEASHEKLTFSGIGIYHKKLFANCQDGKFRLAPLLRLASEKNLLSGQHYSGEWCDVGSVQNLKNLEKELIFSQEK